MPPYPMFTKSKHNNFQGETFPVLEFQISKEDFFTIQYKVLTVAQNHSHKLNMSET